MFFFFLVFGTLNTIKRSKKKTVCPTKQETTKKYQNFHYTTAELWFFVLCLISVHKSIYLFTFWIEGYSCYAKLF